MAAMAAEAEPKTASPKPTDLFVSGSVDDAITQLKERIQHSPNDAEAYHLLGRAYFHLRKWDDAINFGERAVSLAPNNATYYMWLGRAYGEKADASNFWTAAGLTKKIKVNFEKAVDLDAKNVQARADLAEFYIEAPGFMGGGTDRAKDQASRMAQLDQAQAHWINARIAEKKKDYATAENEYRQAISASNDATYWLNLASFYRRTNRVNDMETAIRSAMNAEKKPSNVFVDAATLLYRTGRNLPDAANFVRKYLSSTTPNEDAPTFYAHYMFGAILEKQGDKAASAAEYKAALQLARDFQPAQEGLKRVGN